MEGETHDTALPQQQSNKVSTVSVTVGEELPDYVGQLVARAERLQKAYSLCAGAQFRAVIHHRRDREDAQWVHMLGALSYSQTPVAEERWESQTIVSGLDLLKAELPLHKVDRVLAPILKLGIYETYPGQGLPDLRKLNLKVTLASPSASPPSIGPPEEMSREYFEPKFGEPHPGIVYFIDSHLQVTNELRLSPGTLAELGYMTVEHLLWHTVLNPNPTGSAPWSPNLQKAGLYVVLPNYHGQIQSATIEGTTVKVKIDVESGISASDFDVTLVAWASDGRVLPPLRAHKLGGSEVTFTSITPPSSLKVRLVWNLGANDSERFVDERRGEYAELVFYPRLVTYGQFDSGLKRIESFLNGDGKDQSNIFEWALATLLSIAGFQVVWPGYLRGKGKKEVDLVAFVPESKRVFFVECTLALGDIPRKITSVVERAQDFSPLLKGADIGKALATNLRDSSVNPSDKQDAGRLGVALLTAESLTELQKAVRSAVPLGEIVRRFLTPTTVF